VVLTVPRRSPPIRPHDRVPYLNRPPAGLRKEACNSLRAREGQPNKARRCAPGSASPPPPVAGQVPTWPLRQTPQRRREALAACEALQARLPVLRGMSARMLRHLLRPFFAAGWAPADVLTGLQYAPAGQHIHTREVYSPAGWVRWRLSAWLGLGGHPVVSPSQAAAEAHRLDVIEAAQLRAARVNPAPEVARAGAALARQFLAARPRQQA
jgi:hypothetical protein